MQVCLVDNTTSLEFYQRVVTCVQKHYGVKTVFKHCREQTNYKDLTRNVRDSDVVIGEISQPSTRVGLSIAIAFQLHRPIVLFYRKETRPAILECLDKTDQENLQLVSYDKFSLEKEIVFCLEYAFSAGSSRFNFFITASIGAYLHWIAEYYHLPRSVYLRRLIEKDLKQNQEYLATT